MAKKFTKSEINDALKEVNADNEKEFLREIKKKNREFLVEGIGELQRERIAKWIDDQFNSAKLKHQEICDKIDEFDKTYRMERKEVTGGEGELPNYRSPMSAVALEVMHSKIMNVFFTPTDVANVLPTEEGDISKVDKLSTFLNWSADNELDLFTNMDRLLHSCSKNGECPYLLHWDKQYETEIVRDFIPNPADPTQPLIDSTTKEPLFQERDEQKLVYNAPKLIPFSRKDYIQPKNALMDKLPDWEMRKFRMTYDKYLREELQGKMYPGSIKEIRGWGSDQVTSDDGGQKEDYEGDEIPVGEWEQEFVEFYGRMRITVIKQDAEQDTEERQELEDEFIAVVHLKDQVLCSLRRNKFPLKMRPIGVAYFYPDDEGRRSGLGVMELMESLQLSYDAFFNQAIFATIQSNSPIIFFTPTGNMRDEPLKIKHGFMYPTTDPSGIKEIKLSGPDTAIGNMLEIINNWAQLLFGISDFSAGLESRIDPSAPAKKAELVVQQGNVRMNQIVKRYNKVFQDIFKRWFLLYKDNMPPNKFMRIVGDSKDNPWEFKAVTLEDFALNNIPDFELTGNILNENKALDANKALAIYQVLIQNPLFLPQTQQGLRALHSLTKWLINKMDEVGLSRFVPDIPGEDVATPEEENARFLQGDVGEPTQGEDHVNHIQVHRTLLVDQTIPDEIKEIVVQHINQHVAVMRTEIAQQEVLSQVQPITGGQDVGNAVARGGQAPQGENTGIFEGSPGSLV